MCSLKPSVLYRLLVAHRNWFCLLITFKIFLKNRFIMINPPQFTEYYITGLWTDQKGLISHFCVHEYLNPGVSGGEKYSKDELVSIVEKNEKPVFVFGWDYRIGKFVKGEQVILYSGYKDKILWTQKKEDRTKNLKHLIRINWFEQTNKIDR